MTGPAAQGVRIEWAQIPAPVRAAIEEVCGAVVVRARTQPGDFSPGLAARVRCADGARYFVKAVSANVNIHIAVRPEYASKGPRGAGRVRGPVREVTRLDGVGPRARCATLTR